MNGGFSVCSRTSTGTGAGLFKLRTRTLAPFDLRRGDFCVEIDSFALGDCMPTFRAMRRGAEGGGFLREITDDVGSLTVAVESGSTLSVRGCAGASFPFPFPL